MRVFTIGLGTKGYRRDMAGTVQADFSKMPQAVQEHLVELGLIKYLQQRSQVAERNQIQEWEKAHPKQDAPIAARFPWDLKRLEKEAVAAMAQAVKDLEAGKIAKAVSYLSAVDRRAAELAEAGLRAGFIKAGKVVPKAEELVEHVARALAHPEAGPKLRAKAQAAIDAEAKAAQAAVADLGDLLTV